MIAGFRDPMRALLFTLGGAVLAWLWVDANRVVAVGVVLVVFVVAGGLQKYGEDRAALDPEQSLRMMETRLVSIGVLTAATSALGIVITIELATDATGYEKQITTVVSGALVAFVSGVTYTADKVDAAVGKYIAAVFQAAYPRKGQARDTTKDPKHVRELDPGSIAERALASSHAFGLTDWSYDKRHKRIEYLIEYLIEDLKAQERH